MRRNTCCLQEWLNGTENGETRELLDKIYNGEGTSISECEARNIKKMLSRESNFAEFKRSVVLQSEELMQSFGELIK